MMLLMIFSVIALFIFCYVAVMALRIVRYVVAARAARQVTRPYNRLLGSDSQHMLILGDSTMYGAGTKHPEHTFGGLLASKYPGASIETLAENGAKVKDLHGQLARAQYTEYDLIVVGVGGNDIVKLTQFSAIDHELIAFLDDVTKIAPRIILCHCVNVGNIGFFLFPLNYFYDYRTRRLSQLYARISSKFPGVSYVNFYRPIGDDHYDRTTRKKFIAGDAFHPNDHANQYFFDIIWRQVNSPK